VPRLEHIDFFSIQANLYTAKVCSFSQQIRTFITYQRRLED